MPGVARSFDTEGDAFTVRIPHQIVDLGAVLMKINCGSTQTRRNTDRAGRSAMQH